MSRVLYIYNRYYQGRSELGPTSNWELTWLHSLCEYFGDSVDTFSPDAFGPDDNTVSDQAISELINAVDYQLIVMIPHIGIRWKREFISKDLLSEFRTPSRGVVAIWGDIQIPQQRKQLKQLSEFVDINLVTASAAIARRFRSKHRVLYSWVPVEYGQVAQKCTCPAKISFGGSIKHNRAKIIQHILDKNIDIHVGGGEGNTTLSREQYLRVLSHPVSLSFRGQGYEPVLNARTFEILSQGSLLLEQFSRETANFLIPFEDYVPWKNKKELIQFIERYSRDDALRSLVAKNGVARLATYNSQRLWSQVLENLRREVLDTDLFILKTHSEEVERDGFRDWYSAVLNRLYNHSIMNISSTSVFYLYKVIGHVSWFIKALRGRIKRSVKSQRLLVKS
jgi:hypothetical protein